MLMKVGSKGWVTNRSHDLPERVAMKANKWLRGCEGNTMTMPLLLLEMLQIG